MEDVVVRERLSCETPYLRTANDWLSLEREQTRVPRCRWCRPVKGSTETIATEDSEDSEGNEVVRACGGDGVLRALGATTSAEVGVAATERWARALIMDWTGARTHKLGQAAGIARRANRLSSAVVRVRVVTSLAGCCKSTDCAFPGLPEGKTPRPAAASAVTFRFPHRRSTTRPHHDSPNEQTTPNLPLSPTLCRALAETVPYTPPQECVSSPSNCRALAHLLPRAARCSCQHPYPRLSDACHGQ